ncbi:MAG: ABC transporter permease [Oscillospiraceae bacterium]|nr:ABC transporter permease [Oscillospiraceae bacterium]
MSTNGQKKNSEQINFRKIMLLTLAVYVFLVLSFYFLAGDQLRLRVSRGSIEMPEADIGAAELSEGVVVEQLFQAPIQRLESVSVKWGTNYRRNAGAVTMELLRPSDGTVLMQETFDAARIAEGQVLTISAAEPIETVCDVPLILRLQGDSAAGSAVTPLVSSQETRDGFSLLVNGEAVPGILCFSADGQDYIWTGLHYWKFASAFGAAILICFFFVWYRWKNGKRSYIIQALIAVKKYRFLIRQLVGRDFRTKYKRSVLGVFWSFLNPLLMMLVQYFVFSTIFKSSIPNFPAYLIIGTIMFNFFSESCGMTLTSILGNASLITKVYMPKYIYPLTRTMSSVVNLVISLIPMILVCLITGVQFKGAAILSLFFFVCLIIFSLGMGLLLATSMVFFRDTQFLWGVLNMMWMYITPIFYPETILSGPFMVVLKLNPLYHFLKSIRMCILDGLSPEPVVYFRCMMIALGMLLAGVFVFRKNQDKFVLYL